MQKRLRHGIVACLLGGALACLGIAAPAQGAVEAVLAEAAEPPNPVDGQNPLVQHLRRRFAVPESKAIVIVQEAYRNAVQHQIRPELILAVILVESTFKERATNAGALGLMQVIPRWHQQKIQEIGGVQGLYDPAKNIRTGTRILMEYLNLSRGNLKAALSRYKGEPKKATTPYAEKIMRHYEKLRAINTGEEAGARPVPPSQP